MNICLFSASTIKPHRGGVADYTYWVARALTARGHHVLCITTSVEACAPDVAGTLEVLPATAPDLLERVTALLRQHSVSVLWMQTLQPVNVSLCRLACNEVGAKLVCHLHVNPRSVLIGYRDCLAEAWLHLSRGRAMGKQLLLLLRFAFGYAKRFAQERRRYRHLLQVADALVVLSEHYVRELQHFVGLSSREKIYALPNPVTVFPRLCNVPKQKEVLYVGRLPWQHKRVDRLLKAWRRVEPQFPEWQLTIVGEGAAQQNYEELAMQLGLRRVRFAGKQDPVPYYARARIFCMTSSCEGFPLVLLEAQASGCVPVAFDSFSAVRDVIEDSVNGCLVRPFDIDAYAETLCCLMSDESKLVSMAESAQQSVSRFSSDVTIGRVEALLEQIATQR